MAKILVTGGAGFIGSHICEALVKKRHRVTVLDDFSTGKEENLARIKRKIRIIRGDIRDRPTVEDAMKKTDYVIHEAAFVSASESVNDPKTTYSINVDGTKNVLDGALKQRIKKVVLASSAAVYGNREPPLKEMFECHPLSPYGESKLLNEYDAVRYITKFHLPIVCLRYFNVYGPRQRRESGYAGVITSFINALNSNEQPVIYGDGSQTRDFIYVEDVARATLLALKNNKANGEVFNIATGKPTTIRELALTIARLMKKGEVKPNYAASREGDITHSWADISKAAKILKFKPKFSLDAGLRKTIKYFAKT